jgi:hypothetical protein
MGVLENAERLPVLSSGGHKSREGGTDRLTQAIVAYGSTRTPDNDEAAVLALDPVDGGRG